MIFSVVYSRFKDEFIVGDEIRKKEWCTHLWLAIQSLICTQLCLKHPSRVQASDCYLVTVKRSSKNALNYLQNNDMSHCIPFPLCTRQICINDCESMKVTYLNCGRPEKYSGLYEIWTRDLCDTGAALYHLS